MKNSLVRAATVAGVAGTMTLGLLITAPSVFAGGSLAISKIVTSSTNISSDETFNVKAYVNSHYGVKTIQIFLDGKVQKVCKKTKTCAKSLGPFDADASGEHVYMVLVIDKKNQHQQQWGKFFVNVAPEDTADTSTEPPQYVPGYYPQGGSSYNGPLPVPQVPGYYIPAPQPKPPVYADIPGTETMSINKLTLAVGETLTFDWHVMSKSAITQVAFLVDGKFVKKCPNTKVCATSVGPFTNADVGMHTYRFAATNVNGYTNGPFGKFWVYAKADTTPWPPVPPQVPSTLTFEKIITNNHQLQVGDSFTGTIYAVSNRPITNIDVKLDGALVKSCSNTNICGATMGPFAASDIGEHKYEFFVTDASGKQIQPWGKFWVNAAPVPTPVPAPTPAPSSTPAQAAPPTPPTPAPQPATPELVNMITDGNAKMVGDTMRLSVNVKDAKGIARIYVKLDDRTVVVCSKTTSCGAVLGPFTASDIGEHTYTFHVINLDGQSIDPWGKYTVSAK